MGCTRARRVELTVEVTGQGSTGTWGTSILRKRGEPDDRHARSGQPPSYGPPQLRVVCASRSGHSTCSETRGEPRSSPVTVSRFGCISSCWTSADQVRCERRASGAHRLPSSTISPYSDAAASSWTCRLFAGGVPSLSHAMSTLTSRAPDDRSSGYQIAFSDSADRRVTPDDVAFWEGTKRTV